METDLRVPEELSEIDPQEIADILIKKVKAHEKVLASIKGEEEFTYFVGGMIEGYREALLVLGIKWPYGTITVPKKTKGES